MTATEYLTINDVDLNDPDTYWIENLGILRGTAERRGLVEPMPYTPGGIAYTHRDTVTEFVFELFITGTSWADLDDNETYIRTNVVGVSEVLTVVAEWNRNNGELWAADVIVKGLYEPVLIADGEVPIMRYNLPILIPAGQFAYLSGS